MTMIHTDVLVLGSCVGGLTVGTYLAHAGIRVVLLEEESLVKRPPVLREPFLLSGLDSGGCARRVIQELAIPLIEQRRIQTEEIALQVLMPHARIDVRAGREALASEMEAYGVAPRDAVLEWFGEADLAGDEIRASLLPEAKLNHGPALVRRLVERSARESSIDGELAAPPESLEAFVAAMIAPLSGLAGHGGGVGGAARVAALGRVGTLRTVSARAPADWHDARRGRIR